MEDDFGFVCFRKGPAADDYTNIRSDNVYVIRLARMPRKHGRLHLLMIFIQIRFLDMKIITMRCPGYYDSFRDTESVDLTITRLMKTEESPTII